MQQSPKSRTVDIILKEIEDFESESVQLSDFTYSNQYQRVQQIKTHQNNGFFKPAPKDQHREFFDIITPMVKTAVANSDLDAKNLEAYTERDDSELLEIVGNSLISQFARQTNEGTRINQINQQFLDEGNIVARRDKKSGYIYDLVDLRNLYVIDQTARTLEDTTVIEKQYLNNTELRQMKEWKNIDQVEKYCNYNNDEIPQYEVFKRYGEISKEKLNYIKSELNDEEYEEGDKDKYVNALIIMAKVKKEKDAVDLNERRGVVVFAEELKPEKIKISEQLELTFYKPFVEGHLGVYSGTWLRKGYREIGIPYQNFANKVGNKMYNIIDHLKFLYVTSDSKLTGKNIFSNIKDGQIITADEGNFQVLNNQYPNLGTLIEKWNWNHQEAMRALKAFEAASGEQLPSSVTATAANIQNQAVGRFYNFVQEEIGLFYSALYKRWVMPTLIDKTTAKEKVRITGDAGNIERYADLLAEKEVRKTLFQSAMEGTVLPQEQIDKVKEVVKQKVMQEKKLFHEVDKKLFDQAELYVGINTTGEMFNQQNKISNGLQIAQMLGMDNPKSTEILAETINDLGFRVSAEDLKPQTQQAQQMRQMQEQMQQEQQTNNTQV